MHSVPDLSQPLDQWLCWLETIHPIEIDMGLARVSAVADRLQLRPSGKPLILVGGTNGKGSTVAMLCAIYAQAGYKAGSYSSPHITHFCERIKIDQQMVDEALVVEALHHIESHRDPQSLTYFEYTTLAAMYVLERQDCDVLVFEVGLGGRLDATNIWDANCSIITSIARDHEAYLGSDISVIATEKAAIGRSEKPLIVGEVNPPASLASFANEHGMLLDHVGAKAISQLPKTSLPGVHQQRNAACAVAAANALQQQLPVSEQDMEHALAGVSLQARFDQRKLSDTQVVLDVAHNPAAALALRNTWMQEFGDTQCELIFACLNDKDIDGIVSGLQPIAARWHCLALDVPRALSLQQLQNSIHSVNADNTVFTHYGAQSAWHLALESAQRHGTKVLVAGSFYTIAAIDKLMSLQPATVTQEQ